MDEPINIIMPGRIKSVKGTKDGISLVSELIKKNLNVKIKIIGKVQSEKYLSELLEEINKKNLSSIVEYSPMMSRNALAQKYQQASICFFPSYLQPGLSRVPLEAMASGTLIITYGNEGSKEIIKDGVTGFIVSEGDYSAAADKIESLLEASSLYRKVTQNARQQIKQNHTLDRYIDEIEKYLYESMESV